MQSVFTGAVYVVRDNIDTDQIIPAQYLTLVPTIPDEYEKLGSYALCGLPDSLYPTRFVKENRLDSEFPIVVGGKNFGCGSSREHAPLAYAEAGIKCVIAEFYARIFFRNSVNGGYVVPLESVERLVDKVRTGDELEVHLDEKYVLNKTRGGERSRSGPECRCQARSGRRGARRRWKNPRLLCRLAAGPSLRSVFPFAWRPGA